MGSKKEGEKPEGTIKDEQEVIKKGSPEETSKPVEPDTSESKLPAFVTTGWTSYVLITIGLLVVLMITAFLANQWINSEAKGLTEGLVSKDTQIECKVVGDSEKQAFINKQRSQIIGHANTHRDTAVKFFGYFYATFAVFSVFGLLAAISLAVIARKGLDGASPHLITVFFVSTGIVLLYQGFFAVF